MVPSLPTARELVRARQVLQALGARAMRVETDHPGGRLCWRRWGQGPDLVLLHGGHGSWMHWVRNIEPLSKTHTLWVPDMPGFGDSDTLAGAPHDPNRLSELVQALCAGLAQLLGPDRPLGLVGFSFGGVVALQLATTWPQTQRLALLGPAGHGGIRRQATELLNWRGLKGQALWQTQAHNLGAFMLHNPHAVDAVALVAHQCSSQATRFRSKSISRQGPLLGLLGNYSQDLLLLWGEHDVTAEPPTVGPLLLEGHQNRHLVVVPDAGHWVQFEQSDVVNRRLAGWFEPA